MSKTMVYEIFRIVSMREYGYHFFFIGSQVSPTPSFLKILWSTSESITVEWT